MNHEGTIIMCAVRQTVIWEKVARDFSLCLRKQMAFMKYRKPKQKHHLIPGVKRFFY